MPLSSLVHRKWEITIKWRMLFIDFDIDAKPYFYLFWIHKIQEKNTF